MQNIVYVFIKSDSYSVQLLENILIMLVGGYTLKCHCLQLIVIDMIDDKNSENKEFFAKMSELVHQYNNVRNYLKDIKTNMCKSEVAPPVLLRYSPHAIGQHSMFQNNQDIQKSLGLLVSLNNMSNFCLGAEDKIVLMTSINNNFDDLNIARSVISHFSQKKEDTCISVVYDLTCLMQTHKIVPANLMRAFNVLEKECKLVVVGLKDMYKPTFTQLQTACAVLDSINHDVHGEPLVCGERNNLCYTSENLPSDSAAKALARLALLGSLWIDGIENVAPSWIKNLRIKEPWNDIPVLYSIAPFLSYLRKWMDATSNIDFSLGIKDSIYKELIKELNNIPVLSKTSSQEYRRKEATLSLLTHLEDNSDTIQSSIFYKPFSKFKTNSKWEYNLGQLKKEISPTIAFDLMDYAFSEEFYLDKEASVWRSICLDLWELFFVDDKQFVDSYFEINEYYISKELNLIEHELLSFSEVGRMMIDADVYYTIKGKGQPFIAYTSPLTGFCVSENAGNHVEINSRCYLSTNLNNVCELKDRSNQFQQFLYSYINMRKDMFSDNFKSYIDKQIMKNKALIQSQGTNVIKLYPQYRKHIPLDIENK